MPFAVSCREISLSESSVLGPHGMEVPSECGHAVCSSIMEQPYVIRHRTSTNSPWGHGMLCIVGLSDAVPSGMSRRLIDILLILLLNWMMCSCQSFCRFDFSTVLEQSLRGKTRSSNVDDQCYEQMRHQSKVIRVLDSVFDSNGFILARAVWHIAREENTFHGQFAVEDTSTAAFELGFR
jgi:hypothetical protein